MTMTPEERAVVQAAITAFFRPDAVKVPIEIRQAVSQLITRCPQCNAGGHTCPGDGNPIDHGDTDCGEHDEPRPERTMHWGDDGRTACGKFSGAVYQYTDDRRRVTCAECLERGNNQPEWVTRTWVDVRPGDRVRLPATEHVAEVASAIALPWHVHPAADPYRPNEKRAEWQCINVHLHERESALSMDPAAAIEIELTPSEVAAIEVLGGWSNRVRQERA